MTDPSELVSPQPSEDEARSIYESKFVIGPGFDKVQDPSLRAQLIDYGVNSGPGVAIKRLQNILLVEPDGILGPLTLEALNQCDPIKLGNHLVISRIKMLSQIVSRNPAQAKFLAGWVNRACEFLRF